MLTSPSRQDRFTNTRTTRELTNTPTRRFTDRALDGTGRWEALFRGLPGAQAEVGEGCVSLRRVRRERSYFGKQQTKCHAGSLISSAIVRQISTTYGRVEQRSAAA